MSQTQCIDTHMVIATLHQTTGALQRGEESTTDPVEDDVDQMRQQVTFRHNPSRARAWIPTSSPQMVQDGHKNNDNAANLAP